MSKRVIIMIGVAILLIIGSMFLMKHEIKQAYGDLEPEAEAQAEPEAEAQAEPEAEAQTEAHEEGTDTAK